MFSLQFVLTFFSVISELRGMLKAQKRKKENDLKKCEQRIEKLEEEKASLEEKMCDPSVATDVGKLQELSKKIEETDGQLSEAYEEWERLAE